MFAIMWSQKNKGDKPHYKPGTNKKYKKYQEESAVLDANTKISKDEKKKKAAAERKKRQDADNKAYTARARKAGYKNTQDYTNVVARYGSEDNYRKGKGLGT